MPDTPQYKVGEIVYLPYAPQQPGKIIEVLKSKERNYQHRPFFYRVKWLRVPKQLRGYEDRPLWELNISSLHDLISDHAKKLKNHKTRLKQAQEL